MIADPWREELHAYIGGILREIDATPLSVGGPGDHVHVLLSLKATHTLSEVTRQMKRGSSLWIHRQGVAKFAWQEGYGAFTVSESQVPKVHRYIERQEEHHRSVSFLEEFKVLLKAHGLPFDERYL